MAAKMPLMASDGRLPTENGRDFTPPANCSSRLCGTYTILTIQTILAWKSRGERGQFEMSLAFQTSAPVR